MTIQQQAFLKTPSDNILLSEATIRAGWVDAVSYKPARIPPIILEALK